MEIMKINQLYICNTSSVHPNLPLRQKFIIGPCISQKKQLPKKYLFFTKLSSIFIPMQPGKIKESNNLFNGIETRI